MKIESCFYHIDGDAKLLRVTMLHSWDLATTIAFCQLCNQCIKDDLQQEWAILADLRHWCLSSEQACDQFYQHHKQCISSGLKHQAIILPKSNLKRWRIRSFVADDYGLNTIMSNTEEQAIAWLVEHKLLDPIYLVTQPNLNQPPAF